MVDAIKRRLFSMFDAMSQFLNVAILPRIFDTDPNESISGRSYREGVAWRVKTIDFLFSWYEEQHCRKAFEKDYVRAANYVDNNEDLFKNPRIY